MTKKKNKQQQPAETPQPSTSGSSASKNGCAETDTGSGGSNSTGNALIICRNKHWRYISSFHGPWLQLPPEILESLAHLNFNCLRPCPIDPGVFYDVAKIRRLVDDATDRTVRSRSGVRPDGRGNMSSKQRDFHCDQAVQKLARAYRLDEIATSVVTMQGATPVEDVAAHVLKRKPNDPDAKYVHFFHEKIPSRQLVECTSLDPLSDVIRENPSSPEPLRTRAAMRIFREEYELAIDDLSSALNLSGHRLMSYGHHHPPPKELKTPAAPSSEAPALSQELAIRFYRRQDLRPKEDEQPSSLDGQLLFQRAGVYLTMACLGVDMALSAVDARPDDCNDDAVEQEPLRAVKALAKKAMRDYMAFLDRLQYSPNYLRREFMDFSSRSTKMANDSTRAVTGMSGKKAPWLHIWAGSDPDNGSARGPKSQTDPQASITIYSIKQLFNAIQPDHLPEFPPKVNDMIPGIDAPTPQAPETIELVSYHPLLVDALHSLLLCHALLQTSKAELGRHATMVARLVRLAEGFPVFQPSRSPARTDWVEVLAQCQGWLELPAASWELLSSGTAVANKKHNALSIAESPYIPPDPRVQEEREQAPESDLEVNAEKDKPQGHAVLVGFGDERICKDPLRRVLDLSNRCEERAAVAESDLIEDCSNYGAAAARSAADDSARQFPSLNTLAETASSIQPYKGPVIASTANGKEMTTVENQSTTSPSSLLKPHNISKVKAHLPTAYGHEGLSEISRYNARRLEDAAKNLYPVVTERATAVARWVAASPKVKPACGKRKKKGKVPRLKQEGSSMSSITKERDATEADGYGGI